MEGNYTPHRSILEQLQDADRFLREKEDSDRIFEQLKQLAKVEYKEPTYDVRNGSKFYNSRNNKRKHKK
jgi:hypothetical protein